MTLTINGAETRVVQDFGMRKFHADGKQLYMNNQPLYVRGVIRARLTTMATC